MKRKKILSFVTAALALVLLLTAALIIRGRNSAAAEPAEPAISTAQGEKRLSDEQALSAVKRYCCQRDPGLENVVNAGEYPVYWEVSSSADDEIVILYRSYTGALLRYHIDPTTGQTYVTEFVPGLSSGETQTDELLNLWEYID